MICIFYSLGCFLASPWNLVQFLFLEFKSRTLYLINTDFPFFVFSLLNFFFFSFDFPVSSFFFFIFFLFLFSVFIFIFVHVLMEHSLTTETVISAFTHVISCPHHVHDLSGGLGLLVLNIVFLNVHLAYSISPYFSAYSSRPRSILYL